MSGASQPKAKLSDKAIRMQTLQTKFNEYEFNTDVQKALDDWAKDKANTGATRNALYSELLYNKNSYSSDDYYATKYANPLEPPAPLTIKERVFGTSKRPSTLSQLYNRIFGKKKGGSRRRRHRAGSRRRRLRA
jgi:hypothetical protein